MEDQQKTPGIRLTMLNEEEMLMPMKVIFNFFDRTSQEYERKELWELLKSALSTDCWTFMNEPGIILDLQKEFGRLLEAFYLLLKAKEDAEGEVKLEISPCGSEQRIKREREELYQLYEVMNEHRGRIKRLTKLEIADPYLAIKAAFEHYHLDDWKETLAEWCEYSLSKMTLMDVMNVSVLLDLEYLEKMLEVAYLFNKQYGERDFDENDFMEQLVKELNRDAKHPINKKLLERFRVFIDVVPPERLNRNLRKMMVDYLHSHKKDGLPEDFDKYLSDLSQLTNLLDSILQTIGFPEKEEDR
jgi:hypothetical protein